MLLTIVLMVCLAYLMGSISSAILLCRLFKLPDPRTSGSNNPGATNMLRVSNKYLAASVLIFDILKGVIPVYCAFLLNIPANFLGFIAIAACLGHMFPIFFNYQGGKAVATTFGVILPIGFILTLVLLLTWFIIIKSTRYSSLAAIITMLLAPLYTWFLQPAYLYPVIMIASLVIIRHKDNIIRLINGTEDKLKS